MIPVIMTTNNPTDDTRAALSDLRDLHLTRGCTQETIDALNMVRLMARNHASVSGEIDAR